MTINEIKDKRGRTRRHKMIRRKRREGKRIRTRKYLTKSTPGKEGMTSKGKGQEKER